MTMTKFHPLAPVFRNTLILASLSLGASLAATPASTNPYLGQNITRTYAISELLNRPGLLTLGKGDMLYLDYDQDVDTINTPDGAMMDIPEWKGNVVTITGKVATGTAQLLVTLVDGKITPLVINFTPKTNTLKRIRITDIPSADYAQPQPPAPVVSAGLPAYRAPITSSAALGVGAAPAPITRAQPDWLKVELSQTGNTVAISVSNAGPRALKLARQDLNLSADGSPLSVNLNGDLDVAPGQTQVVTLPLSNAVSPGAALMAEWLAYDAAASTYYKVRGLTQ